MKIRFLFLCMLCHSLANAWGFYGHKKINEIAVYTLPKPLFAFYKQHVNYIMNHAADPDKRRYVMPEEACRHYLDGDFYESKLPFDTLPRRYQDAIEKYGEDTITSHGIVPWHIQTVLYRLTEAFKSKDINKILKLSGDLGHYIGDLHVPLHATSNYNGQKTNQVGIHALWESRLLELYFDEYDLFTGLAKYLDTPRINIWMAFEQSYGLVDSVLLIERYVTEIIPENEKYSWEIRGNQSVRVYSQTFCKAYHDALGSMVEDRLKASIKLLGSFWYTAWVNAGQPDLESMPKTSLPNEEEEEKPLPFKSQMIGREEE